jgi:hypothetical protein
MNWKWIEILSIRAKPMKLLEENKGNIHDLGFDNVFLDMTAKA